MNYDLFSAAYALIIAFIACVVLGAFVIPKLHNFGQNVRDDGPKSHLKKQGTPSMGGIFMIGAFAIATLFFVKDNPDAIVVLLITVGYGLVGFLDDYIKVVKKRNLGLTAKQKLVFQFAIAIAFVVINAFFGYGDTTCIPFAGTVHMGNFAIIYHIISVIVIVGVVNAVNLADGIDGLVGSETFFVAIFYMIISSIMTSPATGVLSAAVAGGCLGFLLWNFNPAKVFMGDTGSLFLGGIVCALAYSMNMPVILIPMALTYLLEMLSVILQVTYFKITHGKRLFKMSPIHHHFEKCGWSETKIVVVFSAFTIVICGIVTALVILGL